MSWNEEAETTQFKVLLLHHHMNEYGLKVSTTNIDEIAIDKHFSNSVRVD